MSGAVALTLASIPSPSISAEEDPIFAAIERHRQADAAVRAAGVECDRLLALADAQEGPMRLSVLDMSGAGRFKKYVEVTCLPDIDRYVPREVDAKLNSFYRTKWKELRDAREAIHGDIDEFMQGPFDLERDALKKLLETQPKTFAGLTAYLKHLSGVMERESWRLDEEQMAQALANMAAGAALAAD